MKQIYNGRIYDTSLAIEICSCKIKTNGAEASRFFEDSQGVRTLYVTMSGRYFFAEHGNTDFVSPLVLPTDYDLALEFAQTHFDGDNFIQFFMQKLEYA